MSEIELAEEQSGPSSPAPPPPPQPACCPSPSPSRRRRNRRAPPPPPPPPHQESLVSRYGRIYRRPFEQGDNCLVTCSEICVAIISVGILVIVAVAVRLFFYYEPETPTVELDSLGLHHFKIHSPKISYNMIFSFTLRNPNKKCRLDLPHVLASLVLANRFILNSSTLPWYELKAQGFERISYNMVGEHVVEKFKDDDADRLTMIRGMVVSSSVLFSIFR